MGAGCSIVRRATMPGSLGLGYNELATLILLVAVRVCEVPAPRALEDRPDGVEPRFPAERLADFCRIGHQLRRITGAGRTFHGFDGASGDLAGHLDDFFDRVTVATTKVEHVGPGRAERQPVPLRQVENVDVITDARAIGGGILCAVDIDEPASGRAPL